MLSVKATIDEKVDSSMMRECDVVDIEASANLWDKNAASVGILHTNGNVYTGGSYDNYVYGVKIPVQQGDVVRAYYSGSNTVNALTFSRVTAYKSDGTVVPSSGASDLASSYTVPQDITSIIMTILISYNNIAMLIVNDDIVPSEYIPYQEADAYYIATIDFIPENVWEQLVRGKQNAPETLGTAG